HRHPTTTTLPPRRSSDLDKEARLVELKVLPDERVLAQPGSVQRLLAMARYTDGTERDVTSLVRFQSQNDVVAGVSEQGVVTAKQDRKSTRLNYSHGSVSY